MKELTEIQMREISGGTRANEIFPNQSEIARLLSFVAPPPASPYDAGNGVYRAA